MRSSKGECAPEQLTSPAFSIDNHSRESGPLPMNTIRVHSAFAIPDAIINRESPLCINIIRSACRRRCCRRRRRRRRRRRHCRFKPFRNPFSSGRSLAFPPLFRLYHQARGPNRSHPFSVPLVCRNNAINPKCGTMT